MKQDMCGWWMVEWDQVCVCGKGGREGNGAFPPLCRSFPPCAFPSLRLACRWSWPFIPIGWREKREAREEEEEERGKQAAMRGME